MKSQEKRTEGALSPEFLEKMADRLKTLAPPQRLRIIELLESAPEAPVHAIMEALDVPQATASHHLSRMRRAGLIGASRRGKEIWYRIADPDSLTILNCIRKKGKNA